MVRNYSPEWQELYADVDIVNGGVWIKDYGDYADVIEVTELGSAAGADGRVLVDVGSVGIYESTLGGARRLLDSALSCCGPDDLIGQYKGTERRLAAWGALWSYGARDVDSETVIKVEDFDDPDYAYGFRETETVDGTDGLKRYLWEQHQLDTGLE